MADVIELTLATPNEPTRQAVSTAITKQYLRVEHNEDDALVDELILAATQHVEDITRRSLMSKSFYLHLDCFPTGYAPIVLPRPPLASVTAITYTDGDGATQTLAGTTYVAVTGAEPGEVWPVFGSYWPSARRQRHAVRVEFVAGYGDEDNVPDALKAAINMYAATLYENRETFVTGTIATELPMSAKNLVGPYRVLGEF